jgi:hypothetical protein
MRDNKGHFLLFTITKSEHFTASNEFEDLSLPTAAAGRYCEPKTLMTCLDNHHNILALYRKQYLTKKHL